jgi:hypothetical protein
MRDFKKARQNNLSTDSCGEPKDPTNFRKVLAGRPMQRNLEVCIFDRNTAEPDSVRFQEGAITYFRHYVAKLANMDPQSIQIDQPKDCTEPDPRDGGIRPARAAFSHVQVVLISRRSAPMFNSTFPKYVVWEYSNELFASPKFIPQTDIFALAALAKSRTIEVEARRNAVKQKLTELASAGSAEEVGSISISWPEWQENVRFCTLEYSGDRAISILGYRLKGLATQSPEFQQRALQQRASVSRQAVFAHAFPNLESAFQQLQANAKSCHVFVDFPQNIVKLLAAVQRVRIPVAVDPSNNELAAAINLQNEWAKQAGFADFSRFSLARSMNVDKDQFETLAKYGINSLELLEATRAEMKTNLYSTTADITTVLQYLQDKADAGSRKGATVLTVKKEREAGERIAEAKRAAASKAAADSFAREFPFYAVISCSFSGRNTNVLACFAGKVGTEVELRNGSQYGLYRVHQLLSLGRETKDGLVIDLREMFEFKAQNSADSLILGVKVYNRKGDILFEKEVPKFGVIRAKN